MYPSPNPSVCIQIHEPAGSVVRVPEVLVHDLWARQAFDASALETTGGVTCRILDPGRLNTHEGPDFSHAHIQLGDVEWHGDVELHVSSRDWQRHQHAHDPRYDSVVLHVTLYADKATGLLRRPDGTILPEVVLAPRLQTPIRRLLHAFHTRQADQPPCAPVASPVPQTIWTTCLDACAEERLLKHTRLLLDATGAPSDDRLYQAIGRGLGYRANAQAMTSLTGRVSRSTLLSIPLLEARLSLLLRMAGLAHPDPLSSTPPGARAHLQRHDPTYPGPAMLPTQWRRAGVRPANRPRQRLTHLASLFETGGLFSQPALPVLQEALLDPHPIRCLRALLRPEVTETAVSRLGVARADVLLTNVVLPYLNGWALHTHDDHLADQVRDLYRLLPPSRDAITRRYRSLGPPLTSAWEAQGVHQLHRAWCTPLRCLSCAIGQTLWPGREGEATRTRSTPSTPDPEVDS